MPNKTQRFCRRSNPLYFGKWNSKNSLAKKKPHNYKHRKTNIIFYAKQRFNNLFMKRISLSRNICSISYFSAPCCVVLLMSWGEAKRKCWVKPNKSAKNSKFSAERKKYNSKAKLKTENNKLEYQNVKLPYRLMFAGCWSQFFKTDSVIYDQTEIPSNIKTLWFQNMQLWIFYANRIRT